MSMASNKRLKMTGYNVDADQEYGGDKGGGYHGPPRRWTGAGPRPARHVPWPEIFKHHESVLTGHLKMVDMVRKHCVEGTGNHRTADACVDRTKKMLAEFRDIKRNFVPPRDNVDRVPLGSSSASMYPGYSPADHIYGEAAAEYGQQMHEAKQKGVEFKLDPNGPQYEVGQTNRIRKEQLEEIATKREEAKRLNDEADAATKVMETEAEKTAASEPTDGVEEPKHNGEEPPLFFMDSNPTPVILNGQEKAKKEGEKGKKAKKEQHGVSDENPVTASSKIDENATESELKVKKTKTATVVDASEGTEVSELKKKKKDKKRPSSMDANGISTAAEPSATEPLSEPTAKRAKTESTLSNTEHTEERKTKKDKKRRVSEGADSAAPTTDPEPKAKKAKHDVPEITSQPEPIIEHEDITAEVEARLKAKEEKRKNKENKKRKREGDSSVLEQADADADASAGIADQNQKPKKKKTKKGLEQTATEDVDIGKKREAEVEEGGQKKKKKGKKGTAENAHF